MYPRLRLLKEFLSEDGIIFICIDDNEIHRLRLLLDEILGEENFVGEIIRKTKSTTNDKNSGFNLQHDTCVIYAKSKGLSSLSGEAKNFAGYKNPDNDPKGDWASGDPTARTGDARFPIENPFTGRIDYPPEGRCWGFSENNLDEYIKTGKIKFRETHKESERGFTFKRYLSELKSNTHAVNSLFTADNAFMNQVATKEIINIFGSSVTDYPKPLSYFQKIISYSTQKDALILDSFAGSGTTAHAVLEANNLDGGNRKFILIEMEEDIAKPVTAERVRRVIDGYEFSGKKTFELHKEKLTQKKIENRDFNLSDIINDHKNRYDAVFDKITSKIENDSLIINGETHVKDRTEGLGGGFRYCYLGTPLFNEYGDISKEVTFPDLAAHIFFSETGMPLPQKADGKTSLIGQIENKIVHLLFSPTNQGVPRETAGNVLTLDLLADLPQAPEGFEGQRVVYAEACTVNDDRLNAENVIFKHIPYHIEGVL